VYANILNPGQGIGRATALGFAAAGVRGLVLSARNDAKLEETAAKAKELATNSGFETLVVVGDISQEDDIVNVIKKAAEKFGKIDYAVNNAGVRLVQYWWFGFPCLL
jgi:NAD(P)-dependent dehydrogenase (short-subunit alcohol dehydrogenase family)